MVQHHRCVGTAWFVFLALVASGCVSKPVIVELDEARRIAADLRVEFAKAADASNRAVMSEADESSRAFAQDAEGQKELVQKHVEALKPLLESLRYPEETRALDEFAQRFVEYRAIDDRILELAVENSNVKAQRLSFGPVQDAAGAIRTALDAVSTPNPSKADWHIRALSATALASVREIQALEAPHIAESDDAAMTRIEDQMSQAAAAAREALQALGTIVSGAARPQVAAATTAFERLMTLNAQVTALSRRNTNVRSLAMSLNEKGKVTGGCEQSLRSLSEALASRVIGGTR